VEDGETVIAIGEPLDPDGPASEWTDADDGSVTEVGPPLDPDIPPEQDVFESEPIHIGTAMDPEPGRGF
jgi:hypothetical protein